MERTRTDTWRRRMATEKMKLVIDTDPGIDDAMAILMAFQSPEVELLGITTVFGNLSTPMATENAIRLREMAGREDVPIARGALGPLTGTVHHRVADFVHGSDGLGNTHPPQPKGKPIPERAADFLLRMADQHSEKLHLLCLGPLTNLAEALRMDPELHRKIHRVVVLGGAFKVSGNVNPAAEANIFGDPDAADIVFSSGCNIFAVGLDVTHRCVFKEEDREELNRHQAGHGPFIHRITDFYLGYHKRSYHMNGFYLHDPAAFAILLKPWLCKWKQGIIRVLREGVGKGMTVMDPLERQWIGENEWTRHPAVQVAMEVNAEGVIQLVKERMGWEKVKEADP